MLLLSIGYCGKQTKNTFTYPSAVHASDSSLRDRRIHLRVCLNDAISLSTNSVLGVTVHAHYAERNELRGLQSSLLAEGCVATAAAHAGCVYAMGSCHDVPMKCIDQGLPASIQRYTWRTVMLGSMTTSHHCSWRFVSRLQRINVNWIQLLIICGAQFPD